MTRFKATLFSTVFISLLFSTTRLYGQFSVETSGVISSGNTTPFWFQSNRNGVYSREGSQLLTHFQYHNKYEGIGNFNIRYGASLIARPGERSTLSLNQGYLKIQRFGFEISAGRFIGSSPHYNEELGIGSLGISNNITPVPKIQFGLTNWTPVPFTDEFIQIRGHIAHGWLGSNRFTEDVLLHEKAGYLKVGGGFPVNLYGGLAHYVKWGGNNHPTEGDIPHRFSDFRNIFFAKSGDEYTPGQEQAYALGSHLGAWDLGSIIEIKEADITLYVQIPIETKYDLKLKNARDALTGISIDFAENLNIPIDRFVYEYLYTKNQSGSRRENPDANPEIDLYRGNQNYYNHGLYKTGWAYNMRTIGNPLFKLNEENLGIVNNRIVAHHFGFESSHKRARLFGKITFSRNYGKRCDNRIPDLGEQELFGIRCENIVDTIPGHSLEQWSFLAGTEIPLPLMPDENISLKIEAALDNGRLFGDQFGLLVGIRWLP